MINISEKILSLRKERNLTQEALGEAVGVTPQAVSKWEKGDSLPDISIIPELCKVFNISADSLLGNEENITSEMYVDKALKICDGKPSEKMRILYQIMADGCIKPELDIVQLGSHLSPACSFSQIDSRGFGMFFNKIEYINAMMSIDLTKSKLVDLMSNEKAIKIFSFICLNGILNENEIVKLTGYKETEVAEQLFILMKHGIIEAGANTVNKMDFSMTSNGIFLLGIMANVFLYEPGSRNGNYSTLIDMNPDNLQKFI